MTGGPCSGAEDFEGSEAIRPFHPEWLIAEQNARALYRRVNQVTGSRVSNISPIVFIVRGSVVIGMLFYTGNKHHVIATHLRQRS